MAASSFRAPGAPVYTNAVEVRAWLEDHGKEAGQEATRLVRQYTLLLETRVKANASGRPGPRARTGDYRRSINSRVQLLQGAVATGTVGTAAPQARRLEYGFVGRDRLGRVYNQPPFPHFDPAWRLTVQEFATAMRGVIR